MFKHCTVFFNASRSCVMNATPIFMLNRTKEALSPTHP